MMFLAASVDERRNCMSYAHQYLQEQPNPFAPVTILSEGQSSKEFDSIF